MCPSSRRGGSLGKSGIGITRSFSSGTPKSASVRKPRCEWTTIRSNRENSRRHIFVLRTERRGSRSCAVNTFGPRARKSDVVDRRRREPLDVQDVARLREQPRHPERVLDSLDGNPQTRPAEDSRRERVEDLAAGVSVGRVGRVSEPEARRDELDLGAGACERGRELVVVGRREAGRVGEDDAH